MLGAMKRVVVAVLGVGALACITALAFVGGAIPGIDGCMLRSVDKREYVAENEAVFSTIPIPPLLSEANETTYSVGITAMDACLPLENGPPYDRYITWHVYTQDPGGRPIGFDRRVLGREWVSQLGGPHEETFRRGRASLYVHFSDEAVSLGVDNRAH
jgi:hypothetical protein